jgi:hypothetical protein
MRFEHNRIVQWQAAGVLDEMLLIHATCYTI